MCGFYLILKCFLNKLDLRLICFKDRCRDFYKIIMIGGKFIKVNVNFVLLKFNYCCEIEEVFVINY